ASTSRDDSFLNRPLCLRMLTSLACGHLVVHPIGGHFFTFCKAVQVVQMSNGCIIGTIEIPTDKTILHFEARRGLVPVLLLLLPFFTYSTDQPLSILVAQGCTARNVRLTVLLYALCSPLSDRSSGCSLII